MLLDLLTIINNKGAVLPFQAEFDFSDVPVYGEFPFMKPVKISGSVSNRTGIIELNAQISADLHLKCSRCIKDIFKHQDIPVFHILSENGDNSENPDAFPLESSSVDLKQLTLSNLLLNMDMVNLCCPDCKGLCPVCGKNLNFEECLCSHNSVDPRLEPLRKLLENFGNN